MAESQQIYPSPLYQSQILYDEEKLKQCDFVYYSRKTHYCRRCTAHSLKVKLSGHAMCPFKNCKCKHCNLITSSNNKAATYIRRRRIHSKLEEYIKQEAKKPVDFEEIWELFYPGKHSNKKAIEEELKS